MFAIVFSMHSMTEACIRNHDEGMTVVVYMKNLNKSNDLFNQLLSFSVGLFLFAYKGSVYLCACIFV